LIVGRGRGEEKGKGKGEGEIKEAKKGEGDKGRQGGGRERKDEKGKGGILCSCDFSLGKNLGPSLTLRTLYFLFVDDVKFAHCG